MADPSMPGKMRPWARLRQVALTPEAAPIRAHLARGQLAGEHGFPLEDLVAVALESPEGLDVALAGLRALLGPLGYRLEPVAGPTDDLAHATAGLAHETGEALSALTLATADGIVTAAEAIACEREIDDVETKCRAARSALRCAAAKGAA